MLFHITLRQTPANCFKYQRETITPLFLRQKCARMFRSRSKYRGELDALRLQINVNLGCRIVGGVGGLALSVGTSHLREKLCSYFP